MSTQTQCTQSTDVLTNHIRVVNGNVLIATNMQESQNLVLLIAKRKSQNLKRGDT
nr:MAG TPA: hypothetical protein [Caudoviricetes sp.]DAT90695.1 MAG TPA: hypothetical protein [Bacteriophage sp.]